VPPSRVGQPAVTSMARKILIGVLGLVVLAVGIVLLVLPGPGLLIIVLGSAILSLEFSWARRAEAWARNQAREAAARARQRMQAHAHKRFDRR
jgi:uncharacterized protein (TIGR02611 family)